MQAFSEEVKFISDLFFFEFIFRVKGRSFRTKVDAAVSRLSKAGLIVQSWSCYVEPNHCVSYYFPLAADAYEWKSDAVSSSPIGQFLLTLMKYLLQGAWLTLSVFQHDLSAHWVRNYENIVQSHIY